MKRNRIGVVGLLPLLLAAGLIVAANCTEALALTPNQKFVNQMYLDLLVRPASPGELTTLSSALDSASLTRTQAEAAWAPLLDRMKGPIQRALRDASLTPEQIDEVLLVGGSTRMPCVAKLAANLFGRLPLRTLPPDEAVAMGAAVQAALKGQEAAVEDMVVTDVAPFSMGIAISMMATSGLVDSARRTASRPSDASPTTSMPD